MTIHQNTFVLSILILFFISSAILDQRCHPDDRKALLQIKQGFNNSPTFASWIPDTDCCGWQLVDCDNNDRIYGIWVKGHNEVAGCISDAIGDLPYLLTIIFFELPKLIGPIPQAIIKLTSLSVLSISRTHITGPIPAFLSNITSLKGIDLSFNKLTGSIPSSLANLPNLASLILEHNLLTGPIPDSFGRFKNNPQISLLLANNQLSGSIPKSIGEIKNYFEVDVSRNNLTGDPSVFFGKNKNIIIINLSKNKFTFDMSKVEFPKSLYNLDLSHNKIYGSLPISLTKIPTLQQFNVSYNQLCGQIPKGGELNKFDESSYVHNKCLCGPPLVLC